MHPSINERSVLGGTARAFPDLATLEEEGVGDGHDETRDEREEQTGVLKAEVVLGVSNRSKPCDDKGRGGTTLGDGLTKSWVIQSGTVAPIQLRINVLAAMAEAA